MGEDAALTKDSLWGDPLGDYLKSAKTAFFEALSGKEACDLRLVVGPEGATPLDMACCTIGAAYDQLLEMRAAGRATAATVPVLRIRRAEFAGSPLEQWLGGRGLTDTVLLFSDDAEPVLQLA